MFKSQLQEYAQKASIPSPVYEFVKEGASHEPRFKASVILNNRTYSSPPGFPNLKAAEHAAAKAALDGIFQSNGGTGVTPSPVHESGLCKNMLQEYAQKNCLPLPVYQSHRSGEDHAPTFTSSVEIAGVRYTGGCGKNKKEAEIKAARTAYLAIKSAQPPVCAPQFLADSVPPQNVGLATLVSSQMPTSGKRRGRGAANPMAEEPMARRLKTGLQTPHAAQEGFMKAGASTPMTPPGPYCPTMTPASYVSSVYTVPAFSPAGLMQGNYYPAPAVLRQPVFSPPAITAAPVIQPSPPAMTAAPVSQPSPPAMTAAAVSQPSPPAMTAAPVTQPSLAPVAEAPATVTPAAAPESIQAPVTVPAEPAPIAIAPNLTGDVIQGPATLPDVPEVQQVPAVSPTMPTVDISDLFVVPEARKILEKIPKLPRPEQPLVTEETSLFSSPVQGTAILSTSSVLAAEQQSASTDNHAVIQEPKSAVENGEAAEGGKETPVENVQLELVNGPPDAKDGQPIVQTLQSSDESSYNIEVCFFTPIFEHEGLEVD